MRCGNIYAKCSQGCVLGCQNVLRFVQIVVSLFQTIKVHQETVDSYLEGIILDAIERTADAQARKEVHDLAEKVNEIAYEMETS